MYIDIYRDIHIYKYRLQKITLKKNVTFFYKECKRTQRMPHSFIKNVKERKECHVLL